MDVEDVSELLLSFFHSVNAHLHQRNVRVSAD